MSSGPQSPFLVECTAVVKLGDPAKGEEVAVFRTLEISQFSNLRPMNKAISNIQTAGGRMQLGVRCWTSGLSS